MKRGDSCLIAVAVIGALFCVWTNDSSGYSFTFGAPQNDFYNQLATAFLHGHLSLLTKPPEGLLKLSNPYNPQENFGYQGSFHDLALYDGRFYLTWGPIAVLVLFIPWRILHIGDLPVNAAVLIFSIVGLWFVLAAFRATANRLFGQLSRMQVLAAASTLATCSIVPFLNRRPSVYEVAISSGYCFVSIGAYFLVKFIISETHKDRNLVIGSLALGLAPAGRTDLLIVGVIALPCLWIVCRREWADRQIRMKRSLQLILPFACAVTVLVFAYNYLRFGSILNVGEQYALTGYDSKTTPLYQLGYLWPSLYSYLVAPTRLILRFPFFVLPPPPGYPGSVPATYSPEVIGGMLTSYPIILWSGAMLFSRRARQRKALVALVAISVGIALVIVASIAYSIPGGTERYEVDFGTLLLFPALLVWMEFNRHGVAMGRASRWIGSLAIVFGVLSAIGTSITGYFNPLPSTEPGVYSALVRLTNPLPNLLVKLHGSPVLTYAYSPNDVNYSASYLSLAFGTINFFYLSIDPSLVDVDAPSTGVIDLLATISNGPYIDQAHGIRYLVVSGDGRTYKVPFRAENLVLPVHVVAGSNQFTLTAIPVVSPGYSAPFLAIQYLRFEEPSQLKSHGK